MNQIDTNTPEGLAALFLSLWDSHPEASRMITLQPDATAQVCSLLLKTLEESEKLKKDMGRALQEAHLTGYNSGLEDASKEKLPEVVLIRKSSKGYMEVGTFNKPHWNLEAITNACAWAGVKLKVLP